LSVSLAFRPGHRVFVFEEPIDMRAGFDRLAMLIRDRMQKQLVDGDLFVFLGNNRRRMKALCFDGTGLVLISKRLDVGRFMRPSDLESAEISSDELDLLLRGASFRRTYFGEMALTRSSIGFKVNPDAADRAGDQPRFSP
jgi:transposase